MTRDFFTTYFPRRWSYLIKRINRAPKDLTALFVEVSRGSCDAALWPDKRSHRRTFSLGDQLQQSVRYRTRSPSISKLSS